MPSTPTAASLRSRLIGALQRLLVDAGAPARGRRTSGLASLSPLPSKVPVTFFRHRCSGHGSLLKFISTRAAFAPPGPGAIPVPRLHRSYAALRLPRLRRPRLWFPSPSAYPDAGAVLCGLARMRPRTAASLTLGDLDHRRPRHRRLFSRRDEGLPGSWAVLFARAAANHPAECVPPPRPSRVTAAVRLQGSRIPWALGNASFRGCLAAAHSLARLRIAGPVAGAVARLASEPGGLGLARAGFAPAGRLTEFRKLPHVFLLPDQPFLVARAPIGLKHS